MTYFSFSWTVVQKRWNVILEDVVKKLRASIWTLIVLIIIIMFFL